MESPAQAIDAPGARAQYQFIRMTATDAIWITWESQPRNQSMARALGVPYHELSFHGSRASRYVRGFWHTAELLARVRPRVVFAPNPSLVLAYVLLALRPVFRYTFVSDAHYGGVVSVSGSRTVQWLLNIIHRQADLVVVTNDAHAERIRRSEGTPYVCPDPLPSLALTTDRPAGLSGAQKSVLFICSYDQDEPYRAVFEAARSLEESGFRVFASGRFSRVGLTPADAPHVTLLGFLDRATYEAYLRSVDVVLDLTTLNDCLVCGAYEAMVAHKPCVLSRTPSLTALFNKGTVFTSHEPERIAQAVHDAYERRDTLASEIPQWLERHDAYMRERALALRHAAGLVP